MPAILFTGGTLVLPDRLEKSGTLLCKDGRILEIKSGVVSSDSVSANNQTVDPTHLSEPNQEVEPQQETDQEVRVVDLQGGYLCPGFVDIHVHGGAGVTHGWNDGSCVHRIPSPPRPWDHAISNN